MNVTWNDAKAAENLRKHGVSFEEAATVFDDPLIASMYDDEHSFGELRQISIGESAARRVLVAWYVVRDDQPHLIGARTAMRTEKRRYMRGDDIRDEPPLDDMKSEYDFSNAVRGRNHWPNLRTPVWLDADVRRAFPTEQIVNEALRALMLKGEMHEMPDEEP